MPTAQGRSATTRPSCVLFDAAGWIPLLKLRRFKKVNHNIPLLQTNFGQHQQTDLHPSAVFTKFSLSCTNSSSFYQDKWERRQFRRRVATQWEDAMSYDFPFLFLLLITRRYSSLLFWSLLSHLYLERTFPR